MSDWYRPYEGYLFDLDGTLVDTAPDISVALNHSLTAAGFASVSENHTRHWIGHGARILIKEALAHQTYKGDMEAQLDAMLPVFLDYYSDHHAHHSTAYPTVVDTLQTLRARGARLAVVTNKVTHLSELILDTLGLREYFDSVVCGDTTPKPKPDPAPVHYCLRELQITPEQALFVGDSNTDVGAARNAGTNIVCVRYGYNQGQDVSQLDVDGVIDTFSELL